MKKRKIPMRTCVVTNEKLPKKELVRIVRNKENEVFIDLTGKKNGRGAYIKLSKEVIEKAKKTKVLSKHLEIDIPDRIYEELISLLDGDKS